MNQDWLESNRSIHSVVDDRLAVQRSEPNSPVAGR